MGMVGNIRGGIANRSQPRLMRLGSYPSTYQSLGTNKHDPTSIGVCARF
jgi:hypothetical protein